MGRLMPPTSGTDALGAQGTEPEPGDEGDGDIEQAS
jgi:hypothetical protein